MSIDRKKRCFYAKKLVTVHKFTDARNGCWKLTNNPRIQAEFYNENKHDALSIT